MTDWERYTHMCERNCEYLLSVFVKKRCKRSLSFLTIRVLRLYVLTCFFIIAFGGMEVREELHM